MDNIYYGIGRNVVCNHIKKMDADYKLSEMGELVRKHLMSNNWRPSLNMVYKNMWIPREDVGGYKQNVFSNINHFKKGVGGRQSNFFEIHDVSSMSCDHANVPLYPKVNMNVSYGPQGDVGFVRDFEHSQRSVSKRSASSNVQSDWLAAEIIDASQQALRDISLWSDRQQESSGVIALDAEAPHSIDNNVQLPNDKLLDVTTKRNGSETPENPVSDKPLFCFLSPSLIATPPAKVVSENDIQVSDENHNQVRNEMGDTQTTIASEVDRLVDAVITQNEPVQPYESECVIDQAEVDTIDKSLTSSRESDERAFNSRIETPKSRPEKNSVQRQMRLTEQFEVKNSFKTMPSRSSLSEKSKDCESMGPPKQSMKQFRTRNRKVETPRNDKSENSLEKNENSEQLTLTPNGDIFRHLAEKASTGESRHTDTTSDTSETNTKSSVAPRTESKWRQSVTGSTMKRRRFVTPLKCLSESAAVAPVETAVETVSAARLDSLLATDNSSTVLLCLEYSDGSSSLRQSATTCGAPVALVIAIHYQTPPVLTVRLCLQQQGEGEEMWQTVARLLGGRYRRVGYDVQQLMVLVLQHCPDRAGEAVTGWRVRDAHVAGWLLRPDSVARSFTDLLTQLGLQAARDTRLGRSQQIVADLQLLEHVEQMLSQQLQEQRLTAVYEQLEVPLVPLLASMQSAGICVNTAVLHDTAALCQQELQQLEAAAHKAAGCTFQLTSPVQLRRVIYEQLQLHKAAQLAAVKLTGGGVRSTSEAALAALSHVHTLPALVVQHRRLHKLKTTYVDGVLAHVQHGAVHPRWQQTAAATGRVQAASPNVQSVPRQSLSVQCGQRPPLQLHARAAFTAPPGHLLVAADFKQVELRLMAQLSGDATLLAALRDSGRSADIFRRLSSEWNGNPVSSVSDGERERTKRVVYATMYGVGAASLAESLACDSDEAQRLMDSFRQWCPVMTTFWRDTVTECSRLGHVTSLLGRRRWIAKISSPNYQERQHAERQAVNFRVQGSAADLCKLASLAIAGAAPQVPLLAQLHDELLWQLPVPQADQFRQLVLSTVQQLPQLLQQHGMERSLEVELPVSISQGTDWAHMTRLEQ